MLEDKGGGVWRLTKERRGKELECRKKRNVRENREIQIASLRLGSSPPQLYRAKLSLQHLLINNVVGIFGPNVRENREIQIASLRLGSSPPQLYRAKLSLQHLLINNVVGIFGPCGTLRILARNKSQEEQRIARREQLRAEIYCWRDLREAWTKQVDETQCKKHLLQQLTTLADYNVV